MTPACSPKALLMRLVSRNVPASKLIILPFLACTVSFSCGIEPTIDASQFAGTETHNAPRPSSLRAAYLQGRQNAAGLEYAFQPVKGSALTLQARNPDHDLEARLDQNGLRLRSTRSSEGPAVSIRLTEQGCASSPQIVKSTAPRAAIEPNRIEYPRQGITEWYANGPLGFEHGFTINQDPGCGDRQLAFVLVLEGEMEAALVGHDAAARIVIRARTEPNVGRAIVYSGLFAVDAGGRELPSRLMLSRRTVRLEVEAVGARYPITVDPVWTEQTILTSLDGATDDHFGDSVAVSGDIAVVGAPDKTVGSAVGQGQAYIYVRSGASWSEQASLIASDGSSNDQFGYAVSADGDTVVVGAPMRSIGASLYQGQAYVYVRSGTTWSEQAKLVGSDGAKFDGFGFSVAVSGGTTVVGALQKKVGTATTQGQAYVYVRSGATWFEQAKLIGSDGARSDRFGFSVAVSGDTAVVGAPSKDVGATAGQGQSYVYVRHGASWSEQAKLVGSNGAAVDRFGSSVAVSGDTAVVGAYLKDVGTHRGQGQAYVFARAPTAPASWVERTKLFGSDSMAGDSFGWSVAISADTIIIGARGKEVGGHKAQGQGYVYTRSGASWAERQRLVASDGAVGDVFGASVAISGGTIMVGASRHKVVSEGQGQAYVFFRPTAPNGSPCTRGSECTSTFCIDGLCCDTICGGGVANDCQSCLGIENGGSDGACGTIQLAANYTCRFSTAICDKPERCIGISTSCPSDEPYKPADMHLCRAATGCSRDTYCDGSTANCPPSLCVPPHF